MLWYILGFLTGVISVTLFFYILGRKTEKLINEQLDTLMKHLDDVAKRLAE